MNVYSHTNGAGEAIVGDCMAAGCSLSHFSREMPPVDGISQI